MVAQRHWLGLVAIGLVASCHARGVTEPSLPPAAASVRPPGLGPGDKIEVRVADQEELSGSFQVSDDGTINYPWVGVVSVTGRSQREVAEMLQRSLADGYLRDPHVTVLVTERQNREVSVLGQVQEPGSLAYKRGLSLVQAISLAGGLTPLALARKVKLIRETTGGRKTYEVDVKAIVDGRASDFVLEAGDIVFVPESPI